MIPRLLTKLVPVGTLPLGRQVWGDNFLILPQDAPQRWLNVLTKETIEFPGVAKMLPLSRVFGVFPVALLMNTG